MTHAACMDNTYHQLHRCTQTRLPSSFSHLKPKHTNWNITNARTHTSPHLYANSASEHEQATESLGKKQGRLPLSLLLHPSSFSSEHFSLSIFSPIRDPHTHLSWHWCTHMHKHTYGTHIFLCPNPCTIPPHPQPLLPSVPPVGCQQLAEAVAMETGPICTLSPWHPPLQEHRDRERERIRRCRRVRLESELEDTRVRQKEIKRRKKKTKHEGRKTKNMHQKWFLLTINHSVTLFLWTINGQLSPHTFPNLLIENECRLKACRLSAVATSKNEGRFNMQLDFIKINWPGEIQKNPAVPFSVCL